MVILKCIALFFSILFSILFVVNWLIHVITDDMKANKFKINLIQDQLVHICQIFVTWVIYIFMV